MFDPFGRKRIRQLHNSLMIKELEIKELRAQMETRDTETRRLAYFLVRQLEESSQVQKEQKAKIERLTFMLSKCDEARKSLGAKLREAESSKDLQDSRFDKLMADYSETVRAFEATKKELDDLYAAHDALVRQIRDAQAVSSAAVT